MNILVLLLSYLLGSFPSAYLIGSLYKLDIRTQGSGNVGTMNTRRTLGWGPALLVFVFDFAKGAAAVYFANLADVNLILAASLAVVGHIYPIWLNFKGGKGLAAAAGALFAAGQPILLLVFSIAFLISYPLIKQGDTATLLGLVAAGLYVVFTKSDFVLILLITIIAMKHFTILIRNNKLA